MNDFLNKHNIAPCRFQYGSVESSLVKDHLFSLWYATIAPINNIAVMEMKEAFDMLRQSRYYRHGVKHNAKAALKMADDYDEAIFRNMRENPFGSREQYSLDYFDAYQDIVKYDLGIFYYSVLNLLTKYDEADRMLKARLITAHCLLSYSIGMFDAFFDKAKEKAGLELRGHFIGARLSHILGKWEQVLDPVCVTCNPISFEDDPQFRLAFKILENKLVSEDTISAASQAAMDLNKEIAEEPVHNPLHDPESKLYESAREIVHETYKK